MPKPIRLSDTISVGLETNENGFMGFLVELPGAFVRGPTEQSALSKVAVEAKCYLKWLGNPVKVPDNTRVAQRHQCKLAVEDGDCEILLDADRGSMEEAEIAQLTELATYSGKTFNSLYTDVKLKDWVDPAKARRTFYGQTPKTIRETFNHVNRTQYYYLSRTGVQFHEDPLGDFMRRRRDCLKRIQELYEQNGNSTLFNIDNEQWTLKKIFRRFIWHDRIHGKAIVRALQKQNSLGLVSNYNDPFCFGT